MCYDVVRNMKTTTDKPKRMETGFRMLEDQRKNLDLLVRLSNGRKKRSHLISEAIDELISNRLNRLSGAPTL